MYETLVMPFGLTNAPALFQNFINNALQPFLDQFASAYLDDIIVYSDTFEEYQKHVRQVLEKLSKNGLYLEPRKCEFFKKEIKYLGLINGRDGIEMDPNKVCTVDDLEVSRKFRDMCSILGFANFYMRFRWDY